MKKCILLKLYQLKIPVLQVPEQTVTTVIPESTETTVIPESTVDVVIPAYTTTVVTTTEVFRPSIFMSRLDYFVVTIDSFSNTTSFPVNFLGYFII